MSLQVIAIILLIPLAVVILDAVAGFRAGNRKYTFGTVANDDFTILIPIYGHIRYLENVEYLSSYGDKVMLCTTGGETDEFNRALDAIALAHGFSIFRAMWSQQQNVNKRATSGTIRDRLIRDALQMVETTYVVPLDADSTTAQPMQVLAGELERTGADLASVRLVPTNTGSLLGRLQRLEYRLAMGFRFAVPWLVSGACHGAKTVVLRDIMNRHSLFFQGNDVETGLIAKRRGYKVMHIPFDVLTSVPDRLKPWFRQRLAWSGGEFRLFFVNARFILHHPFFWFYGGVVAIAALPLRWMSITTFSWSLLVGLSLYMLLAIWLYRGKHGWMLLMPFYALFSSLVMTPLGIIWYFVMARKDRNFGVIKPNRQPITT